MSEASDRFNAYAATNAFASYAEEQRAQANMVTAIGAGIGGLGGYLIADQARIGVKPWMAALALGAAGAFLLRRQAHTGA